MIIRVTCYFTGIEVTNMKSDLTILRENHRFLWDHDGDSWELRLARRYPVRS